MKKRQPVAAFDFDGTLTTQDCLLPFLFFIYGPLFTLFKLTQLLPHMLAYAFNLYSRQSMKEKLLTAFFQGKELIDIQQKGNDFAHGPLKKYLRPQALDKIKWHLEQGHQLILISASTDLFLSPIAKSLGFHHVIASKLALDASQCILGKLEGKNCWGEEKVERLNQLLGGKNYYLFAYGDSLGDRELLQMADAPFYRPFRSKKIQA